MSTGGGWWRYVQNPKEVIQVGKKVLVYLRKGRLKFGVFGAGGTGKSTLSHFMKDGLKASGAPTQLDESYDVETIDLNTTSLGEIVVAPGQRRRVEDHWHRLAAMIASGEVTSVIYTCSFGYHTLRDDSYRKHSLYSHNMKKDDFIKIYQSNCLVAEFELFRDYLAPAIKLASKPIWLLIAITKADLWHDDRANVEKHYREGQLGQLLNELRTSRGAGQLIVDQVLVCARIETLATKTGEILVNTCEGYDDFQRKRDFTAFEQRVRMRTSAWERLKW